MKHIFVSYAREDRKFARQLTSRLRDSGQIPWQDLRNLRGGDSWQTAIDDALRNAEALVVVMSPQATKSQYVTYEWAFALGAGVRVIPVVKKPTKQLHPRLTNIQYIDFTTRRGTPWVKLSKALPVRPSTGPMGPEIRAKFNVVGGKPEMDGTYYVINVYIHNPPRAADQVTYEFHDETLKKAKWSTKAAAAKFEFTFRSNGDSLLTASMRRPGKTPLRISSPLYDALRRGHGSKAGPRIKRALREIRDSRAL
ncbi:MAG TPA: toll/interleukin-1 receptor domain-containing protein [Pyrinomonadaceae bacterium]|nr:toll/interleukin-1 receptor domain-containing protein [Pyrinomonadaceae bacterium]